MKKIININFHSRVVPIEETAYEILQQYIESLRRYFANEEGRDEIISDIENRFAELFSESLKKGATCITDIDVNTIISSMGRPEDFEDAELSGSAATGAGAGTNASTGYTGGGSQAGSSQQEGSFQETAQEPRRLYRAENDKILGGVCAGLANYLKIDPAIMRIIFVLMLFGGGAGFLLYIILWVVLPTRSLPANARKRLYRNSDDRVIAGVASGLAAYFHIDVWIPRLIFAAPLILGIITSILHSTWFDFDGPIFFTGGFGGSLFVAYIVLWIVLPEAVTASEKLEMRGEKVDLESIKNTIKSDLENFNKKAKEAGTEMKETFRKAGDQIRQGTQNFAAEAAPIARKTNNGIGHAIGVMFKAFFLFIAGTIAFALITALIGLAFRGDGIITMKNYILDGFGQNLLAWTAFTLFLVIPVIALLTWLIRRITGTRSRNHYLGYTFGTLWVIGLICFIALIGTVMSNFRSRQHVEENIDLSQPTHGKLVIKATEGKSSFYDGDWWFDMNWGNHAPFYMLNDDSFMLNTVRVNLQKSTDAEFHVKVIKFSHGRNSKTALSLSQQIQFPVHQTDSVLYLPYGFPISQSQKFRNQQVVVVVSIPVGKKVLVNGNIDDYAWFNISANNRHITWNRRNDDLGSDWDSDNDWESAGRHWASNVEYIMTNDGLVRTADQGNRDREEEKKEKKTEDKPATDEDPGYRYKSPEHPAKPKTNEDSTGKIKATAERLAHSDSHLYFLSALFQ